MGMNEQDVSAFEEGFSNINGLFSQINGFAHNKNNPYMNRGELIKAQAKKDAYTVRLDAKQKALKAREDLQHVRGTRKAEWGSSNLAMGGSKQLIQDAVDNQAQQTEEDILYKGEQDAQSILRQAHNSSRLIKAQNDLPADSSTLSLGSKIYKRKW